MRAPETEESVGSIGIPLFAFLSEHCNDVRSDAVVCDDMWGLDGIVSKRLGSRYRSGQSQDWLKFKNPEAPGVKREAEEDWSR
jgi:hypothetical protein